MLEIGQGVKNPRPMLPAVRRRTHAIEQYFEAWLLWADFVEMIGYEDLLERNLAPLQFGEYRREPLRMFIKKRQRGTICLRHRSYRHRTARYRHEPLLIPVKTRPSRK